MSNIIFGVIVVVFCAVGYFYSWYFQSKNNFNVAIFLLIFCGLILRVFTSLDFFLHEWDERYHALVAKHLIHHPFIPTLYENIILPYDYRNWTGNHIWLHKQPLPLWIMAVSLWLFGINEIALRLPAIILSTAGIWLTYSIATSFFNNNKKIGYLAALFFSINGLLIEITSGRLGRDDAFFIFFIELAVLFSITFAKKKKIIYNLLAGVSIGAAILCKWLPALIVLPIWLLIVFDSGNFKIKTIIFQFFLLIFACVLIFLPWQLYIHHAFPLEAKWEDNFNIKHITEVLENHGGSFYYYLEKIRINYGELIYLPLIWFLWKSFKEIKNLKRLAICIWFLIPFLFFSFAKTKVQEYILFTAPALFMMIADFWYMLWEYRKRAKIKWLIILILVLLIALPVRYTIERIKPFEDTNRSPQWVIDLKKLNERNFKNGILFNYNKPIDAMFYTNLTVYPNIPDKTLISDLLQKGYTVIINDNDRLPADIASLTTVKHIKLTETAD